MKLKERKIIIIGSPGSGKSYFSKQLSEVTNIPKYHLDCLYWKENWIGTPIEEFMEKLNKIMEEDEWIIDGNYHRTMEDRIKKADLIFFLDISEEVCLKSEQERRGKKREDLPDYLEEKYDPDFIEFIKEFKVKRRGYILELLKKYSDKKSIIFTTREEKNEFIERLKEG